MLKIVKENIVQLHTRETVCLEEAENVLSGFYNQDINIDKDNLSHFEGDLLALFFNLSQPKFSCLINGNYFSDSSQNMQEFLFHVKQGFPKATITKIKQL